jgi:hypothetical protein
MNLKMIALCGGVTALLSCCLEVWAQSSPSYSGTIGFDGVGTFNGSLVSGASGATDFLSIYGILGPSSGPQVIYEPAGLYAGITPGTQATFTPFSFTPLSTTPFQLWTMSYQSTTDSFDITSEIHFSERCGFLNISGNGIAYIGSNQYTNATWSLTGTGNGITLTIDTIGEGTTITPVPEPAPLALFTCLVPFCFAFKFCSRRGATRNFRQP